MSESLVRSILKALRDFGVQAGAVLLLAVVSIASDATATAALAGAVPGWVAGLLPVVFLVARVAQDQWKHNR